MITTFLRRVGRKASLAALTALIAAALTTGLASPASASYELYKTSPFSFTSSNGYVRAAGNVDFYKDGRGILLPAIYRAQLRSGAVVTRVRTGCAYVKISWSTVSGTASWPPSGSSSTTSDGWYRSCGAAGTAVSLAGQAYASSTLWKVCISLGYSATTSAPRSYQSNWCTLS